MVKGVSRQVIVVKSPDEKMFEQAIFILRTDAESLSDEMLLKEAQRQTKVRLQAQLSQQQVRHLWQQAAHLLREVHPERLMQASALPMQA